MIAADSGDAVTVGRYTTIDSISEAEVDPLAVVAQLRFPRDDVSSETWDSRHWHKQTSLREKLFWLSAEACLEL